MSLYDDLYIHIYNQVRVDFERMWREKTNGIIVGGKVPASAISGTIPGSGGSGTSTAQLLFFNGEILLLNSDGIYFG